MQRRYRKSNRIISIDIKVSNSGPHIKETVEICWLAECMNASMRLPHLVFMEYTSIFIQGILTQESPKEDTDILTRKAFGEKPREH